MSVRQSVPAVTRRSYVALNYFNNALYNYSYGLDEQLVREVGTLTLNPDATYSNCPKGRILHENGRKLNPADVNFRGANDGVATYMVGVYDPVSSLSGFINPNSPIFGLHNTDAPIYLNSPGNDPATSVPNLSNGVLTNGTIETSQSVTANSIYAKTSIIAGGYLQSDQVVVPLYKTGGSAIPVTPQDTNCDIFIDYTAGNQFQITVPNSYSIATINVYFNSNPLTPVNGFPTQGLQMTLLFINKAYQTVTAVFSQNRSAIITTNPNLVITSGQISAIGFTGIGAYGIELFRSGSMTFQPPSPPPP